MKRGLLIEYWNRRLNQAAMALAGVALLLLMTVGVLDILLIAFFHTALPGALEFSESLLVACVFLPLAWTQRQGRHIAMGFLRRRLPSAARWALDLGLSLCSLGFFSLLAWQAWRLAWKSWVSGEYAAGLIAFPLYPAKLALAVGLSLMVLQLLHDMAGFLATRAAKD